MEPEQGQGLQVLDKGSPEGKRLSLWGPRGLDTCGERLPEDETRELRARARPEALREDLGQAV